MLADIDEAVEALRSGSAVIVVDDEDRENEGDIILAAEHATGEWLAWIIQVSSGFVCAPMPNAIADALELPLMTQDNKDSLRTAYTISVDAASGVTTGISAKDRARTLRVLADPASGPAHLIRPGHMLPLRAVDGGVRQRPGHTEAAVDLLTLAGMRPVGVIAEVVGDDGDMMRLPGLLALGLQKGLPVVSIAQLVERLESGSTVSQVGGEATTGVRTEP